MRRRGRPSGRLPRATVGARHSGRPREPRPLAGRNRGDCAHRGSRERGQRVRSAYPGSRAAQRQRVRTSRTCPWCCTTRLLDRPGRDALRRGVLVSRSIEERMGDVRRLLLASRGVHEDRARVAPEIARATGLSLEGVLFGFLVPGDARHRRRPALALSRRGRCGTGPRDPVGERLRRGAARRRDRAGRFGARHGAAVTPRDPAFARELLAKSGDAAISISVVPKDVESIERGEIHVYGRADTVRAVRARARAGVVVRTHGPGLGVVLVSRTADPSEAAWRRLRPTSSRSISADAPESTEWCSSRATMSEGKRWRRRSTIGSVSGASAFPAGLSTRLSAQKPRRGARPRHFIGRVHSGAGHAVGVGPLRSVASVPPPGRHVQVASIATLDDAALALAPIRSRHIVIIVGTDDPRSADRSGRRGGGVAFRVVPLGLMQRLPLDGPVDRRSVRVVARDERTSVVDGPAVGDAR